MSNTTVVVNQGEQLVSVPSTGLQVVNLGNVIGGGAASSPMVLTATTASEIPLTIKGASGQSANLQQWKDSNNNVLVQLSPSGGLTLGTVGTNSAIILDASGPNPTLLLQSRSTSAYYPTLTFAYNSTSTASVGGYGSDTLLIDTSASASQIWMRPAGSVVLNLSSSATGNPAIQATGRTLFTTGNSTTAFVLQNTSGNPHFTYDSTAPNIQIYRLSSGNFATRSDGNTQIVPVGSGGSANALIFASDGSGNQPIIQPYQIPLTIKKSYPGFTEDTTLILDDDGAAGPTSNAHKIISLRKTGVEVSRLTADGGAHFGGAVFGDMGSSTGGAAFNATAMGGDNDQVLVVKKPADTQYRFILTTSNGMSFGPGGSTAVDTNLYRSGSGTLKTDGQLTVGGSVVLSGSGSAFTAGSAAGAATGIFFAKPSAAANYQLLINAAGDIGWGPGTSGVDTWFYRSGVGILKTDGDFQAVGQIKAKTASGSGPSILGGAGPSTEGGITVNNDVRLWRAAAGIWKTDDTFQVAHPSASYGILITTNSGDIGFANRLTADTNDRINIDPAAAKINFGPGNAATDTNFYRSGTGILKSDGKLEVATFRVGTSTTSGYVLTADTSGNATWQVSTGGGGGSATFTSIEKWALN